MIQKFTSNGWGDSYSIPGNLVDKDVHVTVNKVIQYECIDYILTGNIIRFMHSPLNGHEIVTRIYDVI